MATPANDHRTPLVVQFGYQNYRMISNGRCEAECLVCKEPIREKVGTTSNFGRHLKDVHKSRHEAYKKWKNEHKPVQSQSNQNSMDQYLVSSGSGDKDQYGAKHPQQKAISDAIIDHLIVGLNLPPYMVETVHFRAFLSVVDAKYSPMSRSTVCSSLPKLVEKRKLQIDEHLSHAGHISATVDIWTDRRMHSFMAITAHGIICERGNDCYLTSLLLACVRITGSHTGDKIREEFDTVIENHGIQNKLRYIVTDNAANMRKAFLTRFPEEVEQVPVPSNPHPFHSSELDDIDNSELWNDLPEDDAVDVDRILSTVQRLSCYEHTLQLCINDGLKAAKFMTGALGKTSKLASLLHTSANFRQAYEEVFGVGRSIPAMNATRWNSQFRQLFAIDQLDDTNLCELLEREGHKNLCLTARERSIIKEVVQILMPFHEATLCLQGEKQVTVSLVVPSILSLNRHLQETQSRFCDSLVIQLQQSIRHRFSGIFERLCSPQAKSGPYGQDIYFLAAILDPRFGLKWTERDIQLSEEERSALETAMKDLVMLEARKLSLSGRRQEMESVATLAGAVAQQNVESAPAPSHAAPNPPKVPRLFANYCNTGPAASVLRPTVLVDTQLNQYLLLSLTVSMSDPAFDCLRFWNTKKNEFDTLHSLAMHVLSVPASSAPVERVFSQGGLIMKPHRARMSDQMLSNLIFLKCNSQFAKKQFDIELA